MSAQERMDGIDSARRGRPVEESLAVWKEMVAGSPEGQRHCMRFKMNMQARAAPCPPHTPASHTVCGSTGGFPLLHAASKVPQGWCRGPLLYSAVTLPLNNGKRLLCNVQDPNKAMRDPVAYRCNATPHWRTGTKYKAGDSLRLPVVLPYVVYSFHLYGTICTPW